MSRKLPRPGDVVAIKWLDSGTTEKVDSPTEAQKAVCHVATCWGLVELVDDERLVLWGERYEDGTGRVEVIAVESIRDVRVLVRAK